MTYELVATITHKQFDKPVVHKFRYHGEDLNAVLAQIDTEQQHLYNLKKHGKTAFKDTRGVKHQWTLKEVKPDAQR